MKKQTLSVGALCDKGIVKKINQDNILVKIGEEKEWEFGLFVVADGMGGLCHGDIASQIIVSEFNRWWNEKLQNLFDEDSSISIRVIDNELDAVIKEINHKVFKLGQAINKKVGSTLSLLFIYKDWYLLINTGDSRVYTVDRSLKQLSEDQSWVMKQVREGKMTDDEGRMHPKRNILTSCIGASQRLNLFKRIGIVTAGDAYILCSDGFYNHVSEREIIGEINTYRSNKNVELQEVAENLFKKVKERGAYDNISLIMVFPRTYSDKKLFFNKIKTWFTRKGDARV